MKLFGKEINLKNYSCCKVKNTEQPAYPIINLYIQTTPACNGKCKFCDTRNQSTKFNFNLLDSVIQEMSEKHILGKIAIAGGEPLLTLDRSVRIAEKYKDKYLTLNTNAFNLDSLKILYPYMKEIDISKHHYDNSINDKIMGIKTATMEELNSNNLTDKTSINCVFQKEGLSTKDDLYKMMEELGKNNIKNLKAISLLPLTEYAKNNYVDLVTLMQDFESEVNDGYLYDKDMCQCFRFLYVTSSANLVITTIRETFNDNYSCVKQFVFNGEHLYDGFKKKNIIL